jgi:ketosteroid isomerase-like protein
MSRENVEAARRILDGWNRGDVDAWLESAHPEIEWFSAIVSRMEGPQTVHRGVAELRRFWDDWHSVWDLTIEVSELRDLGNTVLALGRMRMRGEASGVDLESSLTCGSSRKAWCGGRVRTWNRSKPSKPWGCRSRSSGGSRPRKRSGCGPRY